MMPNRELRRKVVRFELLIFMVTVLAFACNDEAKAGPAARYTGQALDVIRFETRGIASSHELSSAQQVFAQAAKDWDRIIPPATIAAEHAELEAAFQQAATGTFSGTVPVGGQVGAVLEQEHIFGPLGVWIDAVKSQFGIIPGIVDGSSMEPTLCAGDAVQFSLARAPVERWDIALIAPHFSTMKWIKRVVAFPGETVKIAQGDLIVDGHDLHDTDVKYRRERTFYSYGPRTLGPDEYFALGDNRNDSHDSHDSDFGPVKTNEILGTLQRDVRLCKG